MQPDEVTPGSPQHWLTRAAGHLALAKQAKPAGGFLEDLAFHAQQATELAIKAVFQNYGRRFPWIHNIDQLLARLEVEVAVIEIPETVRDAESLTRYAKEARYPGMYRPVTQEEYERAVQLAKGVLDWAESIIGRQPEP